MRKALSTLVLSALLAAGCASQGPVRQTDTAIATAADTARLAFRKGSMEQAAGLYARALNRSRAVDDPFEIANNAYNLAACKMILRQYAEAGILLNEAATAAGRAGAPQEDIALLSAQAARLEGHAEEARARLNTLLQQPVAPEIRLQADVMAARMDADEGHLDAAVAALKKIQSSSVARKAGDSIRAEIEGLDAHLAQMSQRPADAAAAFDRQAEALRGAGRYREMAQALGSAAQAYLEAGQAPAAWERAYRGARSLFAQGDAAGALQQVETALTAVEQVQDEAQQKATARLFEEIREAVSAAEKKAE